MIRCCFFAITLQLAAASVFGDVFTVGPAGTHATLQAAVTAADALGGQNEIRLQQGAYEEPKILVTVDDDLSLTISGGWNGAFSEMTPDPSLTSLSGGTTTEIMNVSGNGTGVCRLENLTFTEGFTEQSAAAVFVVTLGGSTIEIVDCHFLDNRAGFDDGSSESPFGTAISAEVREESNVFVRSCVFRGNTSRGSSGAGGSLDLSASNDSTLEVSGSSFIGNQALSVQHSAQGGGLKVFTRHDTTVQIFSNLFQDNVIECEDGSAIGGGLSAGASGTASLEITGNAFVLNTVISDGHRTGGGLDMTVFDDAQGWFADNLILLNRFQGQGSSRGAGALLGTAHQSQLTATRNTWLNNSGPEGSNSAQVYMSHSGTSLILTDSLIADGLQNGINGDGADMQLTNMTIANNGENGIRFLFAGLDNSIVYGNGTDLTHPERLPGNNNLICVDPLFADPANGDYRLLAGSPGINAGNDDPPGGLGDFDLPGQDRVFGAAVDIGAYELQSLEHFQYLTQVGNGQTGNIILSTAIDVASTLEAGGAGFTIDFFDPAGGRWELDLNGPTPAGENGVSSVSARLGPGETWNLKTSGAGGIEAGYARIRSGSGIGVTGIFTRQDVSSGTILYQAGVPASQWLQEATLFVDSLGDLETGLAIVNVVGRQDFPSGQTFPAGTVPAGRPGEMFLKLFDQEFTQLGETVLELAAGRHQAAFVSQLFPDVEQAAEMRGVLTVGSLDPIALVTLRQNDAPGVEFPAEVPTLAAFPVLEGRAPEFVGPEPQGAIPIRFFFGQIGNGQAGPIGLQTAMNLANVSAGQVPVQLDFFDSNGDPMMLRIEGLGSGSTFNFALGSGQSRVLETSGQGAIQAGYARVTSEEGLGGSAVFSRTDLPSGLLETESGVPASVPGTSFFLFVDTTGNAETGVALANPTPGPAGDGGGFMELRLEDTSGAELATRELELTAGQHTAQFITQLFPNVEGIDEMRGLLAISSPFPIVAVTLLQNDDPATSFPEDVGTLTAFPVLEPPR